MWRAQNVGTTKNHEIGSDYHPANRRHAVPAVIAPVANPLTPVVPVAAGAYH
jgi:hypothetical protein